MHTDRGSKYCSHDYQTLLLNHGLICSMSTKGCCYDNACLERFFHSLKVKRSTENDLKHASKFGKRYSNTSKWMTIVNAYTAT